MYSEILNFVVENGRVLSGEKDFVKDSLVAEIKFEAQERGLSKEETEDAVKYALQHTRTEE